MLKRSIPILLFVVSIALFTGCKFLKNTIIPKQPKLDRAFSCEFELTAFEDDRDSKMDVKGVLTRFGTGIWEMNITEPETMKGVNLKYNEGKTTATLGTLTLEIESEKLNSNAMFKRVFDTFDACAAMHDIELYDNGEAAVYNGTDCSIAFDKESLLPTMLTFTDGMTVNISSFCDLTEIAEETEQTTE